MGIPFSMICLQTHAFYVFCSLMIIEMKTISEDQHYRSLHTHLIRHLQPGLQITNSSENVINQSCRGSRVAKVPTLQHSVGACSSACPCTSVASLRRRPGPIRIGAELDLIFSEKPIKRQRRHHRFQREKRLLRCASFRCHEWGQIC